jgi:PPOX class probable F420-dependent enzyme
VAIPLDDEARRFVDGKNFAVVATLSPDGSPQSSVVWIDREGDSVVFSATAKRRKVRNLQRDPRISLSIFEVGNPYVSVEIRGRAEIVADPEKRLSRQLSHKYLGEDPPDEPGVDRVIVRVIPAKIVHFAA